MEEGRMGAYLVAKYGRRQPWVRPVIKKPPLDIRPSLGRWKDRLEALEMDFTGGYREQFSQLLAITCGIREAKLVGKATTDWKVIDHTRTGGGGGARAFFPTPSNYGT